MSKEVVNGVRVWAREIDEKTLEQAERQARSDVVSGPIALMADAHVGIGSTIGSVIPTEGAIIPAAVGVDIGCGMIAVQTDLRAEDLPDSLDGLVGELGRSVPAGVGRGHQAGSARANRWLAQHPAHGEFTSRQEEVSAKQLGSLGSGNHFVEVCLDEEESVWALLHSGSRGIGNQLADKHIKLAKTLVQGLEDPNLAYFTQGTPDFTAYVDDMLWAQDYALENREIMMDAVLNQLFRFVGAGSEVDRINCHHNFAARERHEGRDLWITRKGAINAAKGLLGVIPGSMGTKSYIVRGLGSAEAYHSSSHGAGRRMSRTRARKELSVESLIEAMGERAWNSEAPEKLLDEHPDAYKDIDQVMADQRDLTEIVHTLHQVLNYKGF